MKIAIVLNTSWNIYNFRMNLIKSLLALGHEVHTVAPTDSFTRHLVLAGCIHHNLKMDSRGANPIKDMALIFELGSIYRKIKPDVILHFTIKPNVYGTLAAALLKIPVINNVCGLGTVFLKAGIVSTIAKLLYRVSFRYAKKVFFQNQEDVTLFLGNNLIKPEKCELVPGSGIELAAFNPIPPTTSSQFTFLVISRIIYDKGIVEYINAIQLLNAKGINARFQLLGATDPKHARGIPLRMINSWINQGLIEYLGQTEDVKPFINAADCVVLPSYREGSPRSLMEAAALAKPIVTTNVPGCNQVVTDRLNGLLCQVKSAADLAEKMEQMIRLPEKTRLEMGHRGRKKMELEFNEQVVIHKYHRAIQSLLESKNSNEQFALRVSTS
jgi:glycosyltransferase involved in cell wall biosynthesis